MRVFVLKNKSFLTVDTYRGQFNKPDTLHLYAYCANNPINYIDPSGHLREYRSASRYKKYSYGNHSASGRVLYKINFMIGALYLFVTDYFNVSRFGLKLLKKQPGHLRTSMDNPNVKPYCIKDSIYAYSKNYSISSTIGFKLTFEGNFMKQTMRYAVKNNIKLLINNKKGKRVKVKETISTWRIS